MPKRRRKKPRSSGAWRTLDSPARAAFKEDLLRPNPCLGYRYERLADHLMEREAYALALAQYRRMVWLNPFEPRFREKLERCARLSGPLGRPARTG